MVNQLNRPNLEKEKSVAGVLALQTLSFHFTDINLFVIVVIMSETRDINILTVNPKCVLLLQDFNLFT